MRKKIVYVTLCAMFFALCYSAEAQQPKQSPRIGYLTLVAKPNAREIAFINELRHLGWVDGKTFKIEYRRASKPQSLKALADELVRMKVDLIAAAATPAVTAATNATTTIPIVMMGVADALGSGFVKSLAHPGGNITGTTNIMPELAGKRLALLAELLPKLSRVGLLAYEPDPAHGLFVKHTQDATKSLKLHLQPILVKNVNGIEDAFQSVVNDRIDAVIVQPIFASNLAQGSRIASFAAKKRLPTISDGFGFAESGGLLFYGPDPIAPYSRAAVFVDKILKGRKPADLPAEQPTKFQFVVNLKTAKQLGLTIPPNVLARADTIIR